MVVSDGRGSILIAPTMEMTGILGDKFVTICHGSQLLITRVWKKVYESYTAIQCGRSEMMRDNGIKWI